MALPPYRRSARAGTLVYRLRAGERLTSVAIRRLRRLRQRALGTAPAVIYLAGCYSVFSLEELLTLAGTPPRESLLPALSKSTSPILPPHSLSPNVCQQY